MNEGMAFRWQEGHGAVAGTTTLEARARGNGVRWDSSLMISLEVKSLGAGLLGLRLSHARQEHLVSQTFQRDKDTRELFL